MEIVGKKSAFKDATEFLEKCKGEFDWKFEDIDFEITVEDVHDGAYCRYYPRMLETCASHDALGCPLCGNVM